MKVRTTRSKRFALCFFATGALLLLFITFSSTAPIPRTVSSSLRPAPIPRTVSSSLRPAPITRTVSSSLRPPSQCKPSDLFRPTCKRTVNTKSQGKYFMKAKIKARFPAVAPKEYKPENLSNHPAIEGGLYTDRQDLYIPLEGEKYITFAEYLDCLGRNLRVDYRTQQEEEELTEEEIPMSFPYVLSLGTSELPHVKAIMCNVSVPIRRMMYVINSDVSAITNFFHDVEKAFNFTKRLRIHWPGYNMGFAGAVNFAMRDAMRYSFDEVPFLFVLNNDVRFPVKTLRGSLPEFHRVTQQDKAMLESLRAEVANEPSEYTPLDRRHPLLRSTDNSTLLVTSPSLPDRIRYMAQEDRKKIFRKYYGLLCFPGEDQGAALGLSRLAIETVGFFDENFYPAYYEDNDWRIRLWILGYSSFTAKDLPPRIHFSTVIHRIAAQYDARPATATESEIFAKSAYHVLASHYNLARCRNKYGTVESYDRNVKVKCTPLPLDAWVMDVPRRRILMEAFAASHKFYSAGGYNRDEKRGVRLLEWLPHAERTRIIGGFSGDMMHVLAMRAFNNCMLVKHSS